MDQVQFNPYVRFYCKRAGTPAYSKMLCAYDFRLFYPIKGRIAFEFKDDMCSLAAGDVIVIPPGTAYRLHSEAPEQAEFFLVNFDFVFDPQLRKERAPAEKAFFDENQIFSTLCLEPFKTVFVGRHFQNIEPALEEMQANDLTDDTDRLLLRSALMKTVLTKIMINSKMQNTHGETTGLMQDVKKYIYQNRDQKLTNIRVANYFGYHPYYLNEIFSNVEKVTLHKYISKVRIDRAKELLSLAETSISDVSRKMSFSSVSQFSAFFHKATGMTPKDYRTLCK